jgi:cytochrome b561
MLWRSTTASWGALTKLLHWLTVLLIVLQYVLAQRAEDLPLGMEKLATLARHKSVGMTILGIATLRLLLRSTQPTPVLAIPNWERRVARGAHVLLYSGLFALPISGWLMSSAKNYPVSWFGVFQWPDLVAPNEVFFQQMRQLHGTLFNALAIVALLHIVGALKHHFLDRNEVLRRMLP